MNDDIDMELGSPSRRTNINGDLYNIDHKVNNTLSINTLMDSDILSYIFEFLDIRDLGHVSLVNHSFNEHASHSSLWTYFYTRDFLIGEANLPYSLPTIHYYYDYCVDRNKNNIKRFGTCPEASLYPHHPHQIKYASIKSSSSVSCSDINLNLKNMNYCKDKDGFYSHSGSEYTFDYGRNDIIVDGIRRNAMKNRRKLLKEMEKKNNADTLAERGGGLLLKKGSISIKSREIEDDQEEMKLSEDEILLQLKDILLDDQDHSLATTTKEDDFKKQPSLTNTDEPSQLSTHSEGILEEREEEFQEVKTSSAVQKTKSEATTLVTSNSIFIYNKTDYRIKYFETMKYYNLIDSERQKIQKYREAAKQRITIYFLSDLLSLRILPTTSTFCILLFLILLPMKIDNRAIFTNVPYYIIFIPLWVLILLHIFEILFGFLIWKRNLQLSTRTKEYQRKHKDSLIQAITAQILQLLYSEAKDKDNLEGMDENKIIKTKDIEFEDAKSNNARDDPILSLLEEQMKAANANLIEVEKNECINIYSHLLDETDHKSESYWPTLLRYYNYVYENIQKFAPVKDFKVDLLQVELMVLKHELKERQKLNINNNKDDTRYRSIFYHFCHYVIFNVVLNILGRILCYIFDSFIMIVLFLIPCQTPMYLFNISSLIDEVSKQVRGCMNKIRGDRNNNAELSTNSTNVIDIDNNLEQSSSSQHNNIVHVNNLFNDSPRTSRSTSYTSINSEVSNTNDQIESGLGFRTTTTSIATIEEVLQERRRAISSSESDDMTPDDLLHDILKTTQNILRRKSNSNNDNDENQEIKDMTSVRRDVQEKEQVYRFTIFQYKKKLFHHALYKYICLSVFNLVPLALIVFVILISLKISFSSSSSSSSISSNKLSILWAALSWYIVFAPFWFVMTILMLGPNLQLIEAHISVTLFRLFIVLPITLSSIFLSIRLQNNDIYYEGSNLSMYASSIYHTDLATILVPFWIIDSLTLGLPTIWVLVFGTICLFNVIKYYHISRIVRNNLNPTPFHTDFLRGFSYYQQGNLDGLYQASVIWVTCFSIFGPLTAFQILLCVYDLQHQVASTKTIYQDDQFENDDSIQNTNKTSLNAIEVFSPLIILAFVAFLFTSISSLCKTTKFQSENLNKNIFYRPRTLQNLWAYS